MSPPTGFLAAVMSEDMSARASHAWRDRLAAELEANGFRLASDGDIRSDTYLGYHEWLTVDEAAERYGQAPWFPLDPKCPFLGQVAGYFAWTLAAADGDTLKRFGMDVGIHARGGIVAHRTGNVIYPVRLMAFDGVNLLVRAGFRDGDALLGLGGVVRIADEKGYAAHLVSEATRALASVGLTLDVGIDDSHHNRLAVFIEHGGDRKAERILREILSRATLNIWAFDSVSLRDPFWIE